MTELEEKEEGELFSPSEYLSGAPPSGSNTRGHVWTENKAMLIARYLRSFTYVTKHGSYLDAFAGPQEGKNPSPNSWAARLTLENEPKWMMRFVLLDIDGEKLAALEKLAEEHHEGHEKSQRSVTVIQGDSNRVLPAYLAENPIADREACFCLLDQHTRECEWALVKDVARHKKGGYKIELFYFLAQGWIDRVLTEKIGGENIAKVTEWLGHDNWQSFKRMDSKRRALHFSSRFKEELGYRFSMPFPILSVAMKGRRCFG